MISSYCSLVFLKSYTGRFSGPSGLRKSTCRNWAAVLAQETCGCLGTWGRWQVQRTLAMVSTSLLPKFQNSYLEIKTFLGVYSRYGRRVRARSCLLTETQPILSFCHGKYVLAVLDESPTLSLVGRTWFQTFPYMRLPHHPYPSAFQKVFVGAWWKPCSPGVKTVNIV